MEFSQEALSKLEYKEKNIDDAKQGAVFRLKLNRKNGLILPEEQEEKPKFFIIMGLDDDNAYGISLINSKININKTSYYQSNFYKLYKSNYDFLLWDSYVDCNGFLELPQDQLMSNHIPTVYQGDLLMEDLDAIKSILRNCKTISKIDLKTYNI